MRQGERLVISPTTDQFGFIMLSVDDFYCDDCKFRKGIFNMLLVFIFILISYAFGIFIRKVIYMRGSAWR